MLGEDIGVRGRTIDDILTRARNGADVQISRGTMLLVDEAGMASTHQLDTLVQIAAQHGAVVRLIGDPAQLSAVNAGGALGLLARDTRAPELEEVVRFSDSDEREISSHCARASTPSSDGTRTVAASSEAAETNYSTHSCAITSPTPPPDRLR